MEFKFTDSREEQILLGKELFAEKRSKYPEERVAWMYKSISNLMTDKIRKSLTIDELFYLSIYDYWCYGNTISEEIYFHFPFKTHEEKREYMTFRTRLLYMKQLNNFNYSHLFNNKYETYKLFKDRFLREVIKVTTADDFVLFQDFCRKHSVFVVKPTSSHIGIGVRKIELQPGEDLRLLFDNLLGRAKELAKDCFNNDASFLLEELIDQDERLSLIHPYSVNGIRITTLKTSAGIKILYPWFKVGANKSFVTSAAFGTYDAGIDPEIGVVNTDGYKENGEFDQIHPLTGIQFKGYRIPEWNSLVKIVKEMADSVPEVNYIGWDMVLTPQGWSIMEANFTGDFMWQMFNEKGFRREFEDLTGLRLKTDFWWQSD